MALTSKQARHLRSLAHHLDPVVHVGDRGVTEAVVAKVDTELDHHELIKVRIHEDRDGVREAAEALAEQTGAELAQVIGKIAVLYRRRRKKPTIRLPEA
jgi:RNA-binding protein